MGKIQNWFKKSLQSFLWDMFVLHSLPLLLSLGAALIGYANSVPWFYLYIGAIFAFACASVGVLRFSEWRYRITTKDKLSFYEGIALKNLANDGSITGIQLGIQMRNTAAFPLEFSVQDVKTSISDRIPQEKFLNKEPVEIPANGFGWYTDNKIEVQPSPGMVIKGHISIELIYGRTGNLNRKAKIDKNVLVKFNNESEFMYEFSDIF